MNNLADWLFEESFFSISYVSFTSLNIKILNKIPVMVQSIFMKIYQYQCLKTNISLQ